MRSPVLTNRGTWTTAPVSRVAGLVTFETVSPFTPGSVSDTASSTDADRKSTRLNSSHLVISYAVFCLKKKKRHIHIEHASKVTHSFCTLGPFRTCQVSFNSYFCSSLARELLIFSPFLSSFMITSPHDI